MGSKASKETGTTTSCFGGKKERELGSSGPPAHRGPNAIASVARLYPQLSRLDLEDAGLADKGPVRGMFIVRECAEAETYNQKMTFIQYSDPLYPVKQRSDSHFWEGEFLKNHQVRGALRETLPCGGGAAGSKNSQQGHPNMQQVCSDLAAPRFPVTSLKHVTTEDYFRRIVNEGAIRGSDRTFILNGKPVRLSVSCWSPHIPHSELERFKNKRLEDFMQRCWGTSTRHRELSSDELEMREMLASSPALRDDSRYGNFQFTQRLEDLLGSYKEQHCGGQEPALRVLGTEAYKLEVVHWVLIHSPSWGGFEHLPLLDSVWPRSRRGNLLWAPESTTDLYTWYIDPSTVSLEKCPLDLQSRQTYDPSRWNNVVFAFYLPGGLTLNLGRGPLLDSVAACETAKSLWGDSSRILRHPLEKYVSKEEAENIIQKERVKASSAGQ